MSTPYPNLTKPIKIGGSMVKSRFLYPVAQPHFLQGPELYPGDPVTSYYCSLAKNGSGIMLFHDLANDYQRSTGGFDIVHFAMYDINDKGCQNYFSHFTHMIHYYGSKIISSMNTDMAVSYTVNDPKSSPGIAGMPGMDAPADPNDEDALQFTFGSLVGPEGLDPSLKSLGADPASRKAFTKETIEEYIDMWIARAKLYQSLGFDGGMLDISSFVGQFFRESSNKRTDEYGGSRENRERFLHQFLGRARKELGKDFILVGNCPGIAIDGVPAGHGMAWPKDELVDLLKVLTPYIDLLHLRISNSDNLTEEQAAVYPCGSALAARALKDAGVTIPIAGSTTYADLESQEKTIASGDLDLISANHMFMCNERLGEILKEGNGQDLNPCILCHQCRGVSWTGEWMSHCTINPEMGMEYRKDKMIEPVKRLKKVAIIGGGPGGMKAALYLKERGHTPVIFEKSDALGGQIKVVDCADFKWRLNRYREFLVNQIAEKGIAVRLGVDATPEMIEAEDFDVCVVAVGATPAMPKIPGAETAKWTAFGVFGHEKELGKNVVVVGGASTAAEAAIYLAKAGHSVTQICRKNIVAYELNPIRERGNVNQMSLDVGVKHKRLCTTTKLAPGKVTFVDRHGKEQTIECDDVVVSGGMEPSIDLAASFHGCAPEYYAIGDCRQSGNMRSAIFDAYAVSMRI